jgi:hypothetical protein
MVGGPDLDLLTIGALKRDGSAVAHGLINHVAFRAELIAEPQGHGTCFDQVTEESWPGLFPGAGQIECNKMQSNVG